MQPFLVAALIMVCALHSLAHVAYPYSKLALVTMKLTIMGGVMLCGGRAAITPEHRSLLREVPTNVRTAMKVLGLEPDLVVYASC
ncbi:hypothetical protein C8Q78DRAFT_945915, partial [Trametes maxima]